jgi:hypothetical protein
MFNELAERNTREEENGEISLRALQVKRKDLTSLFGKKDTMDEINSGGKLRNHEPSVAISDEGNGEALPDEETSETTSDEGAGEATGGTSMGGKARCCTDVKMLPILLLNVRK